jgi:hypothetical protein
MTTLLSPDGFQTAIDGYVREEYDRERQPAYLSVRDEMFFKQMPFDGMVHVWDEYSNVGSFDETGEQEELVTTTVTLENQKTKRVKKYTKSVPISFEAFKTDRHDIRQQIGSDIGDRARLTQDQQGILDTYGDAFAGSVNTTPDGQALASNSHTTVTGFTVDNLETGALSPDNLWTDVTSLANQRAQDGEAGSYEFAGLTIPFNLYKTAKEVMNSTLIANSGENNLNIFDTDYGQVAIRASVFLTSTYNTATNAATSFHLTARNHQITRMVVAELDTVLIRPEMTANDTYVERARYMESCFPKSWNGYLGANGSSA